MKFSVTTTSAVNIENAGVFAVNQSGSLTGSTATLDKALNGAVSEIVNSGFIKGKTGSSLTIPCPDEIKSDLIVLVGCGKDEEISAKDFRKIVTESLKVLRNANVASATLFLTELPVAQMDMEKKVRCAVEVLQDSLYRFDQCKSKKAEDDETTTLESIEFAVPNEADLNAAERGLSIGLAVSHGVWLAKDLGNLPGNVCTPTYLAEQALGLASKKLSVSVLEEADMRELGMGSLLSVASGSDQPAKLITLEYAGADASQQPIVLVGKGITFDSGGISLKPGAGMDEMKYDMCGAASVLGTVVAVSELDLDVNVVGVIAASENLPNGSATKPGDIVTSMSGQTIEILNTDAEGRLVLCDALTYSKKFEPKVVIDIATLTGACLVALGRQCSAVLANDDSLASDLITAGTQSNDRIWQLPLWEEYQEQLKSNFADMANIGGRDAGTITAACFLSRFTKDFTWAHLDIAGTAWKSGNKKGATGRPVPLLVQYILNAIAAA